MISLTIDGVAVSVPEGTTILNAAKKIGIRIPTLCYLEDINAGGSCRMCIVEAEGSSQTYAACSVKVREGMNIHTDTEEIRSQRKHNLELICSNHRQDCAKCIRFPYCELHALCREYGVDDRKNMFSRRPLRNKSFVHLDLDHSKCILCRRCVSACRQVQTIEAIKLIRQENGTKLSLGSPKESSCLYCGQCIKACPTGALTVKNKAHEAGVLLMQHRKHVLALVSDEFLQTYGEFYGSAEGVSGKVFSLLRKIGFRMIFRKTPFVNEVLKEALTEKSPVGDGRAYFFTACPSVARFLRQNEDLRKYAVLSDEAVLQRSVSALRSAYSGKTGIPDSQIAVISLTSCTAEKSLVGRISGLDLSITSQEMYLLFEHLCVSTFSAVSEWKSMSSEDVADVPELKKESVLELQHISGIKAVKGALSDMSLRGAYLLEACPGGCRNGGGRAHSSHLEHFGIR